jgi:hypothetical protein
VVKKCLVSKAEQLDEECRRELGRSLHMAFFVWYPGGIMTAPCDEDIQKQCLAQSKGLESTPGAVGSCLQDIVSGGGRCWGPWVPSLLATDLATWRTTAFLAGIHEIWCEHCWLHSIHRLNR